MVLILGVAGFAGTMLIGRFLKARLYPTLVFIPALMAVIAVALIAFGSSLTATAILLGIWGLVGTAAPVGWRRPCPAMRKPGAGSWWRSSSSRSCWARADRAAPR